MVDAGDVQPTAVPTATAKTTATSTKSRPRLTVVEGHSATVGNPPLLQAREHVKKITDMFDTNPQAAIAGLEELRREYAPHPLVLHTLSHLHQKSGDLDASLRVAVEALPLLVARGNLRLAAEILHAHLDRAGELDLDRETLLILGRQLYQSHQWGSATRIHRMLLEGDSEDTKAIKGMLQLAEAEMQRGAHRDAREVYRFLLDHCDKSPLADFMRQGLKDADRRAAAS